jgi:REP element-mobilizing transposase RayT
LCDCEDTITGPGTQLLAGRNNYLQGKHKYQPLPRLVSPRAAIRTVAFMEYGQLYFYTSAIRERKPMIKLYHFEPLILDSLSFLTKKECIKVYGFVIMPNHIHLIWELLKANGKESPVASLMKFTAHQFEKHLQQKDPAYLKEFAVEWNSRQFNFWLPDADWLLLNNEATLLQKLNYIHNNPMQEHWNLVDDPIKYPYSSAKFYETGINDFDFLFDFRDRTVL